MLPAWLFSGLFPNSEPALVFWLLPKSDPVFVLLLPKSPPVFVLVLVFPNSEPLC